MIIVRKKLLNFFLISLFLSLHINAKEKNDKIIVTGLGFQIQETIRIIEHDLMVKDKDFVLTADRGMFYPNLQLLKAVSNSKLDHEKFILTCNEISAYIKKEKIIASGDPIIKERSKNKLSKKGLIEFSSKIIQYEKKTKTLSGFSRAKAKRIYNNEITTINSDNVYFYYDKDIVEAINNVVIDNPKFQARSKKAFYYRNGRERIELIGDAWASEKNSTKPNEISGKKIVYYFDSSKISVLGSTTANIRYDKNNDQ